MKKFKFSVLIILCLSMMGIVLAFTYEAPEFRIFLFSQRLDEAIVDAEMNVNFSREGILNEINGLINTLISEGQTFDQGKDLSNKFLDLDQKYQLLNLYVEKVISPMSEIIKDAEFSEIEQVTNSLTEDDQALALEMLFYQQKRIHYLVLLNEQITYLSESLGNFEEMFHMGTRPSQPIFFFQNIANIFGEIEEIHNDYRQATESYHLAKTNYYLILTEMGLWEYFFGR